MSFSTPANRITTFILDMDGVLTDGTVLVLENGIQARNMHVRDGYALQLAIKKGYRIAIVSGGNYAPALDRFTKLGITDVFMSVTNKKELVAIYLGKLGLKASEALFIGDDIPDLEVMQWVGFSACPADAVEEIKQVATYVSPIAGGKGCVREVLERLLKLNNDWSVEDTTSS